MDEQQSQASLVRRRAFLSLIGAAGVSAFLVEACSAPALTPPAQPTPPTGASAPTAAPAAAPTAAASAPTSAAAPTAATMGKLKLPTYIPIQGAKPDLPPSEAGLDPGYLGFPKDRLKSVPEAPGRGGDVTALTVLQVAPPTPLDQNAAWQEINKQVNANMKMQMVPNAGYPARVATTMAGSDLPDLFSLFLLSTPIGNLPQFLKASYTDLTQYLSGDAIKDYPNLANFPSLPWKQTVYNDAIYGVPIPRAVFQWIWYVNQSMLDAQGAQFPTNGDEFKQLLKDFTHPQSGQYGLGLPPQPFAYGVTSPPVLAMFKAPNNWAVDNSGNFTKDIETDNFKTALGYMRDLYASGVYHPDTPTFTMDAAKVNWLGGKFLLHCTGWFGYAQQFWDPGLRMSPPVKFRTLHPFSFDGSPPIWHQYQAFVGMTAVKKGTPDRVKELLRILNWMAAPFASQEAMLIEYGIENTDFNFDEKGNPVLNKQGLSDTAVSWGYLTTRMPVLYDALDPNFANVAYADEQTMVPVLLADPSVGLYSETNASKGALLLTKFNDGLAEIVVGRAPLTDLDGLLREWRTSGGDQMRTEYQQAYAASKA